MRLYTILILFFCTSLAFAEEEADVELPSAVEEGETIWGPSNGEHVYLNLDGCIKRALIHNREIRAASYDVSEAEARLEEADIIGRPVLTYEDQLAPAPKDISRAVDSLFSGELTVFNRFKLGIGIPITTFGKISRAKGLAREGIEAASEKRIEKESEVVFNVTQLYHGVLLAREAGRLLSVAYEQGDKEIKKRERDGGGDPVALLKLKIFRSDMSKRLKESTKKEILALEALRLFLGIDSNTRFDVRKERLLPSERSLKGFGHYRALAYDNRASVKLLQIGLDSARLNYELEKRRYAPDLGVGGFFEVGRAPNVVGVTTTDDFSDPFNFTRAGIGVQLKGEFDFWRQSAKVRQAKSKMLKVRTQADMAIDGIMLDVKKAYLNVKSAREELDRSEESSKLARQVLFLTQSNFDIGLAEAKDLIDAISQFLLTRGDYFKAVFDYNVAFAELDQKVEMVREMEM